MKVIVAGEQISFFERFGYVELESFFSSKETDLLWMAIEDEMELRQKEGLKDYRVEDPLLLYGFDLALSSEAVRKILFSSRLAKAAFAFVRKKPLRYAFDRVWVLPKTVVSSPLEEVSSVTPLMLGVVIALDSQKDATTLPHVPFEYSTFPREKGSVAFISSKTTIQTLRALPGRYLVLGLTAATPMYRLQPLDFHTHALKRHGYVFGDTLKETTHPAIFW